MDFPLIRICSLYGSSDSDYGGRVMNGTAGTYIFPNPVYERVLDVVKRWNLLVSIISHGWSFAYLTGLHWDVILYLDIETRSILN
jgi:hypothetical protein